MNHFVKGAMALIQIRLAICGSATFFQTICIVVKQGKIRILPKKLNSCPTISFKFLSNNIVLNVRSFVWTRDENALKIEKTKISLFCEVIRAYFDVGKLRMKDFERIGLNFCGCLKTVYLEGFLQDFGGF